MTDDDRPSLTINGFCREEDICRSHYYGLRRRGDGPDEMQVGAVVRITREAQARWRREREAVRREAAAREAAASKAVQSAEAS